MSLTESPKLGVTDDSPWVRKHATVDPTTVEHLWDYPYATLAELDDAVEAAHQGFLAWHRRPDQ